jgi:uncharacterized glyoxalase superfamily protein PhnB
MAVKTRSKRATRRKPTAAKKTATRRLSRKAISKRKAARPAKTARQATGGLRLHSAGPSFTVDNIDRSIAWYRDALGFAVGERWEQNGRLAGIELVAGKVRLWLTQDDWAKGRDRVKGVGFRLHCETPQDVDAIATRMKAHGWPLLQEPHHEPWGSRAFAVADPDGFKITISRSA